MNFKSTIPIFRVSAILILIFWNCKKESATNDPTNPSTTVTDLDGKFIIQLPLELRFGWLRT